MNYFAYGSNMLLARLSRRVPSARTLGAASLPGHVLRFHMRGHDGSGKCNAFFTGDEADVVHGVLFEIDEKQLPRLHAAEGPGYEFSRLSVSTNQGQVTTTIYRARNAWLDDALAPFAWYHAFVVAGAKHNGLPSGYIDQLDNIFARRDPSRWRRLKNGWILRGGTA